MSDDKDFPAYPFKGKKKQSNPYGSGEVEIDVWYKGISARDVFAKDAPPVPEWFKPKGQGDTPYEEAKFFEWRWYYADMMLKTR